MSENADFVLQEKLDSIGLGRLRVKKIYGEYDKFENGAWRTAREVVEEFVPRSGNRKPETGTEQMGLYWHGTGMFAAHMPRKFSIQILRRYDFIKKHLEAENCFVLLIPMDKMTQRVADEMRLRYRAEERFLTPEQCETLKKQFEDGRQKKFNLPLVGLLARDLNETPELG